MGKCIIVDLSRMPPWYLVARPGWCYVQGKGCVLEDGPKSPSPEWHTLRCRAYEFRSRRAAKTLIGKVLSASQHYVIEDV